MTIAIIGGGASGMAAAVCAAEAGAQVTLLERQARVGRKLMATGNGRCNLTNENISPECYHGSGAEAASLLMRDFGAADTLDFFRSLGLLTVTEPGGRVYPLSDQAGSVVDVLRLRLDSLGVNTVTGAEVKSIKPGYVISTTDGEYRADRVIVACGGVAGAKLGGTNSGYELLKALGHTATKLCPSLVQLKTDTAFVKALKGVRADAGITVLAAGKTVARGGGEVQFTEYGVSGPAIFDISRAVTSEKRELTVVLDLMRDYPEVDVISMLRARAEASPLITTENLMTGLVHNRLGRTLVRYAGLDLVTPLSDLTERDLIKTARAAKRFELRVTGNLGFDNAQVTAGGVRLGEFDPRTLESRLHPGLYACGEVLDVDGDCGGFNLQWAWTSGVTAGRSAAK